MHYLLFYEKVADYADRQKPFQEAHRAHCVAAVERGDMVLGGSLDNPNDGSALVLFQGDSPAVAEKFAQNDPYVTGGVISRWHVRCWDIVVGTGLQ